MFDASRHQAQKRGRRLDLADRWLSKRLGEYVLKSSTKSSGAGDVTSGVGGVTGFGSTVGGVGTSGFTGRLGSGFLIATGGT